MKPVQKNGSGNVRREDPPARWDPHDIKPGDIVAITPAALRMANLSTMSPRLLYQIGWPNEFEVFHVFETEEDGVCLTFAVCCKNLVDRRTGKHRCTGHPADYFEKIGSLNVPTRENLEAQRPKKPGDRSASASFPWIGEVAAMEYEEDEENPRLKIKIAGKTTMFTGPLAKMFAQVAKDNHIL